GADLSGADLSGADLSGADLSGADLTKARLTKASLRYAELKEAILERTDLTEARLREANLTKANLKDSDLNKASLVGANLEKADLEKANLEKTDLVGAKLNEAKLNEANLRNADLLGTEVAQADFKNVQELNSVKHLSQNQLDSAKNTKDLINSNPQTNLKEQHQEGFSCGPHTRTYAVRSLTKPEIVGVRCLLKTNADTKSNKNKIPNFVWYGEGKFNQKNKKEYRHIGQAFYKDLTLGVGYISELDRYNENKKTLSQSIVKITIVRKEADSVSEFQVKNETGVIEKWTLEEPIKNYTPLIQPTSRFHCGEKFIQYKVYPIVTRRRIINSTSEQSVETDWGLRCVSKHRPHNAITWFGTGQWEGKPYYHLGTKMIVNKDVKKGYGAVDLCGFKQNAYCYKVEGGFLELNPLQDNGFEIKREWSEKWLK
ncbi:pentapeptide repeat-containing protein, partial [Scytonema sp. PCC 10023]|uniref:pentapeptide repeat-containing protein n=1 Tax=Scytonema sp. PCC 10023 TaxID=1680591 RepID=UPI0039C6148C